MRLIDAKAPTWERRRQAAPAPDRADELLALILDLTF